MSEFFLGLLGVVVILVIGVWGVYRLRKIFRQYGK